jgi:hypothetical protein
MPKRGSVRSPRRSSPAIVVSRSPIRYDQHRRISLRVLGQQQAGPPPSAAPAQRRFEGLDGEDDLGAHDARLFGEVAGTRYDMPITEFIELAVSEPADTGSYRGRVLSVHQVGDAANAVVAEDGYWGSLSFIDFFTLNRSAGAWKIVNKTFVHSGGEPPES